MDNLEDLPEPGTPMYELLSANARLCRENEKLQDRLARKETRLARAEINLCKAITCLTERLERQKLAAELRTDEPMKSFLDGGVNQLEHLRDELRIAWNPAGKELDLHELLDAPIKFWTCPICVRPTITWSGNKATCNTCGKTNCG